MSERASSAGCLAILLATSVVLPPAAQAGWHPLSRGEPPTLRLWEPYRPGAIPVVLIHGLASDAGSWEPMIARLRTDPVLADRFQFWTFSYDSCVALPLSAASFRAALVRTRREIDPGGIDPALDRMVLVGQSQGGLIAKMAAQDSGWTLWDATFSRRPEQIRCSSEGRTALVAAFVTRRVASVSRLVFIATPHHGSAGPAVPAARLKDRLLSGRRRSELAGPIEEVVLLNGREVLSPSLRRVPMGAIGGLSWNSPILEALRRTPIAPEVPCHSIIPRLRLPLPGLHTDGIVRYESSHLEGAASEVVVPGPHDSVGRPEVAAEVARILRLHLVEGGSAAGCRIVPGRPDREGGEVPWVIGGRDQPNGNAFMKSSPSFSKKPLSCWRWNSRICRR
ncbi:esterase/lipase family protein [Tautonia sociabilis]|uniref:Alpha/beta hydrolase n=1 Tax=Tautonia sociabilis TaxID=2080755 RepID=A0A432MJQ5_9BACT|nr:hypothetical protein [Tautonia sociabilis]RUL87643.1 hypothetical protein TsocGM_11585 [Tautonia sociabilis]